MRHERSSGGVLVVPLGRDLHVALIVLRGGAVLALPKGRIEAGETPEACAVRETREETGLRGAPIAPLGDISYFFWSRSDSTRVAKRVDFFLLGYRAGSPAHHDGEVDGVRLIPLARAVGALAYAGERQVMQRAVAWLEGAASGPDRLEGSRGCTP